MFGMQFLKNVFAQNKTFCYFAASFEEANRFIDEYTSSATSADELQIPRFDNSTPQQQRKRAKRRTYISDGDFEEDSSEGVINPFIRSVTHNLLSFLRGNNLKSQTIKAICIEHNW